MWANPLQSDPNLIPTRSPAVLALNRQSLSPDFTGF